MFKRGDCLTLSNDKTIIVISTKVVGDKEYLYVLDESDPKVSFVCEATKNSVNRVKDMKLLEDLAAYFYLEAQKELNNKKEEN